MDGFKPPGRISFSGLPRAPRPPEETLAGTDFATRARSGSVPTPNDEKGTKNTSGNNTPSQGNGSQRNTPTPGSDSRNSPIPSDGVRYSPGLRALADLPKPPPPITDANAKLPEPPKPITKVPDLKGIELPRPLVPPAMPAPYSTSKPVAVPSRPIDMRPRPSAPAEAFPSSPIYASSVPSSSPGRMAFSALPPPPPLTGSTQASPPMNSFAIASSAPSSAPIAVAAAKEPVSLIDKTLGRMTIGRRSTAPIISEYAGRTDRERFQQRVTRPTKVAKLMRRHFYVDLPSDAIQGRRCDLCTLAFQLRIHVCQRCLHALHPECRIRQGVATCQDHDELSCWEMVDKRDEAVREKISRVAALEAEIAEVAEKRRAEPFDEMLVRRAAALTRDLNLCKATSFVEPSEMPSENRRGGTTEEEEIITKRRSVSLFGRG